MGLVMCGWKWGRLVRSQLGGVRMAIIAACLIIGFTRYVLFRHHAFEFNEKEEEKDPFLWNALIKTYSHEHDPKEDLWLVSLMLENEVFVNKFMLFLVLKGYSRVDLVKKGRQIHGLLKKLKFVRIDLTLVVLYCIPMEERNFISWNSLISGYAQSKDGILIAGQLFAKIWDLILWNLMIDG
ncbi:unnamed protein product [Dovyalis caffra]|uniref:Uncharacterized protein n=1 Tax=Dovyalis caffra TaxID=77055 RepID=A0AAV1SFQ8_9ROSI|nr:unnamed protein product [Dovyalis caffra]